MPAKSSVKIFAKNKMGMAGVFIIVFFTFMAVFAPFLAQYPPQQTFVAGPWAVPAWASFLPQYQGLPSNTQALNPNFNIAKWNIELNNGENSSVGVQQVSDATILPTNYNNDVVHYVEVNSTVPAGFYQEYVIFNATYNFTYNSRPPYLFSTGAILMPIKVSNVTDLYLRITLVSPSGKTYHLTSYSYMSTAPSLKINLNNGMEIGSWNTVYVPSSSEYLAEAAFGPSGISMSTPSLKILSEKGNYLYNIQVVAITGQSKGYVSFKIGDPFFFVYGRQYGILGTDNLGRDLWSQFVYGSRVSIEVGLLASLFTIIIGVLVGLVAGIFGGIIEELSMRVTDVFLVIPFLPLAIIIIFLITQNGFLAKSLYFWLILFFAILSWPSVARVIRSQVLSLKQRGYVEAAEALGAGKLYIIRRHIVPNVMGLVYANLALSVPGFILTEAALDFLFPGASSVPTWGRMLSKAYDHAASAIVYNFGWWWFIFPGIAIVLLSLAFVMVGYALDEVFNPRLRNR